MANSTSITYRLKRKILAFTNKISRFQKERRLLRLLLISTPQRDSFPLNQ